MDTLERADLVLERLRARYGRRCSYLRHESPFQLLVAVVLSAQNMDRVVDRVTPGLFAEYPTPQAVMRADTHCLRAHLAPLRYAWTKADWIKEIARRIVERHDGEVPRDLQDLLALPGVGPKTASVVQGYVWGAADTVAVDTHANRVAHRLAFVSRPDDPRQAEDELARTFARPDWPDVNLYLVRHGRTTCVARAPRCGECPVEALCPKVDVGLIAPSRREATLSGQPS